MNRIAFINQRSGLGKTLLIREIGICLSHLGKSTLLVDCDPQGDLSETLAIQEDGLYQALTGKWGTLYPLTENACLLPGSPDLSELEKTNPDPKRLKTLLKRKRFQDFEITLLDTPPNLGLMTTLALAAADSVIIPLMPAFSTLDELIDLMSFLARRRLEQNRKLSLLGVVKVYDPLPVSSLAMKEREAEIHRAFGEKVFSTSITKPIWKVFPEDEEPRVLEPEEMVHEDVFIELYKEFSSNLILCSLPLVGVISIVHTEAIGVPSIDTEYENGEYRFLTESGEKITLSAFEYWVNLILYLVTATIFFLSIISAGVLFYLLIDRIGNRVN